MGGRPLLTAGRWVQWRVTRRRCQRITVAGLTITNVWALRVRRYTRAKVIDMTFFVEGA